MEMEGLELFNVFYLLDEVVNVGKDVSFDVHEPMVAEFELIVLFDILWQPSVN